MLWSQYPLSTLKETPADAEIISHQLMLRAGLIRRLASGLYTWLPMGLRVIRKIEAIVREEMDRSGAHELLMPAVQPEELWQESQRWQQYGPELLRMTDRHQRGFCFGPTHEEVITDLARRELRSYKQLPCNFYQIQTKFRDEIRPRFGVMRAREFIMKDAYSFHTTADCLNDTYWKMHETYSRIFNRLGLNFRAVAADSGAIGGSVSHEFHVLADTGEDAIAFSTESDFAANVETIQSPALDNPYMDETEAPIEKVATPGKRSVEEVAEYLSVETSRVVKTMIVHGIDDSLVGLVVRGDHALNAVKAEKLAEVAVPLRLAEAKTVGQKLGAKIGSLGPIGLDITIYVDESAAQLTNFTCGANETGQHLKNVNWVRDVRVFKTVDLRNAVDGDPSPDGQGNLTIARGIEVGHIFQLGQKYSEAMQASVLGDDSQPIVPTMGCYGIGVTRLAAAAIEQSHDQRGIVWPTAIAPFQVVIVPLNAHKSDLVRDNAQALYQELSKDYDVLLDDRDQRPGVKFADCDLLGIPHRIVVTERGLAASQYEYKSRQQAEPEQLDQSTLLERIQG